MSVLPSESDQKIFGGETRSEEQQFLLQAISSNDLKKTITMNFVDFFVWPNDHVERGEVNYILQKLSSNCEVLQESFESLAKQIGGLMVYLINLKKSQENS